MTTITAPITFSVLKHAIYYNDDIMNICDSEEDVKMYQLEIIIDEYNNLVKMFESSDMYKLKSRAEISTEKRRILNKACDKVKICKILIS